MIREFDIDGERVSARAEALGDGRFRIVLGDGAAREVSARRLADGRLHFVLDGGRSHTALVAPHGGRDSGATQVRLDGGRTFVLQQHRSRREGAGGPGGDGSILSPMTGTLLSVSVSVGDQVEAGTTVAVLSAMKMEHKLEAPVSGEVVEVGAEAGATIDQGAIVVRIEPAAKEEA